MTSPPSAQHNAIETPPLHQLDVTKYPTLKQSLSGTLFDGLQDTAIHRDGYFSVKDGGGEQSSRSNRSSPSLFVDIPSLPTMAQTALVALQYLPTPLLVLSSLKTVVLANEAMGRLLGLDAGGEYDDEDGVGDGQERSVANILHGQSLSQIGVDMLQDGQPVWVSWEVGHVEVKNDGPCS